MKVPPPAKPSFTSQDEQAFIEARRPRIDVEGTRQQLIGLMESVQGEVRQIIELLNKEADPERLRALKDNISALRGRSGDVLAVLDGTAHPPPPTSDAIMDRDRSIYAHKKTLNDVFWAEFWEKRNQALFVSLAHHPGMLTSVPEGIVPVEPSRDFSAMFLGDRAHIISSPNSEVERVYSPARGWKHFCCGPGCLKFILYGFIKTRCTNAPY